MAFRPDRSIPDFKDLVAILNNSKIAIQNNPLYQTIFGLIERVSKLKTEVIQLIENNVLNIENLTETVIEINEAVVKGPSPPESTDNAIVRWDGTTGRRIKDSTAILQDDGRISDVTDPTLDQDVATKKYVDDNAGSIDHVVMSDGGVPNAQPINDGAGSFIYTPYTP